MAINAGQCFVCLGRMFASRPQSFVQPAVVEKNELERHGVGGQMVGINGCPFGVGPSKLLDHRVFPRSGPMVMALVLLHLLPVRLVLFDVFDDFGQVWHQIRAVGVVGAVPPFLRHLHNQIHVGLLNGQKVGKRFAEAETHRHGKPGTSSSARRCPPCPPRT